MLCTAILALKKPQSNTPCLSPLDYRAFSDNDKENNFPKKVKA
jgi:hypothetical protein